MPITKNVENESSQTEFLEKIHILHEELLDQLDYDKMDLLKKDLEEQKKYIEREIHKLMAKKKIEDTSDDSIAGAIIDELLGFGPIEPLLRDDSITDIFINGPSRIFVEKSGKIEKSQIRFRDNDHIFRLVQRVASKSGRHLDLGTPYFDAQLPDGSRLHSIISPIAIDGIKVSIRKFLFKKLVIESLVSSGALTANMANLLQIAVKARFNIVICGGTGSGKTTLLNSLLDSIRAGERVITIEDVPELEPTHGHIVRLVTRSKNPEGKGEVSQADLMINALRMRPDRVVLGELRGAEAFNLLHAMNTGQDGSMVTLHASGTEEVISRLLNMILMARYSLSAESVRQQIAGALDIIVYVSRLVDGTRKIMAISQITKLPSGEIKVEDIFRYDIKKITPTEVSGEFLHLTPPTPSRFLNKLTVCGLKDAYLNLFSNPQPTDSQSLNSKIEDKI